jgi:hypothetical protein
MTTPEASKGEIAVPELPEPALETNGDVFGHENEHGFTADQMLSFYQQGVAAERERCAVLCLTHRNFLSDKEYSYADECAAAIRKGE